MGEKHVIKLELHMVEGKEKVLTEFLIRSIPNDRAKKTRQKKEKTKTNQRLFCIYIPYNLMQ